MMLVPFHSANACSLNPTAVISFPQESVFYSGESVYTSGSGSSANCGSISGYLWKNGNTTLSTSMIFSWSINLPAGVSDSVFVLSLRVTNSHGRTHTAYKTVRVTRENNSLYYLTDHLGSVRVTVDEKGNSVGWDDYYPFGLQMPGRSGNSSNPHALNKFTGYEIEEEGGQNTYHAEARGYDPVIGRFTSVDPYAANYPSLSPYVYAANNPLIFIDPDGRDVIFHSSDFDEQTGITTITSIRTTNLTDDDGNITGTIQTRTVTEVRKTGKGESEIVGTVQTVREFQRNEDGTNTEISSSSQSIATGELNQNSELSGHATHVNTARDFVAQQGFGAVFPGDNNFNNVPGTIGAVSTFAGLVYKSRNITVLGASATAVEIFLNRQHQQGPNRNKRFLGREIPKR